VLAQQVMVAPFDTAPGDETRLSMDTWTGYPAARRRLLDAVAERARHRTVVLTGDIHSHWVNELHADLRPREGAGVAAEFVTSSISSGGDGSERWPAVTDAALAAQPHLRWHSARRGYVTCAVDAGQWTSEYRVVPYVSRPGAPLETPTRWRLTHGRGGITRV
jgi:alkaline phosphatase D